MDLLRGVPAGGQAGRGAECARHLLDGRQRGGGGARMGHHPPPGAAHSTSRRFIYSSSSQCYAAVLGLMAAVHAGLRRAQPLGDRHLRLHARVSKVPGVPGLVPTVHSHEVSQLHCTVSGAARGRAGAAADDLQQQHAGQQRALQGGQPRAGGLLHQPAAEPGPRGSCAESEPPS